MLDSRAAGARPGLPIVAGRVGSIERAVTKVTVCAGEWAGVGVTEEADALGWDGGLQ